MRRQRGFSLIELLVAMAATLIVTGAIYGLLSSGNSAFRRQPEVIDRQQNIRLAMDLVSRDVFNAGAALPTFSQVFTRQESYAVNPGPCTNPAGVNGCGIAGTIGASAARGAGDAGGDGSANTDVLEIVSTDERCPALTVCRSGGSAPNYQPGVNPGSAGTYTTRERLPGCLGMPGLVLLTDPPLSTFAIQRFTDNPAASACPSGGGVDGSTVNNRDLLLSDAVSPWSPSPSPSPVQPQYVTNQPTWFLYTAQVTRYMIAPAGDSIDGTLPALWRSRSGRYVSADGTLPPLPGASGFPGLKSPWELVARGIEDLQVEYMAGDGLWHNLPPVSTANDWSTLVRQVRITLSARSSAPNLAGMNRVDVTRGASGPDALRGQLATTISPRSTANALQTCLATPPPGGPSACDASTHIQ